ncbi:MAG: hypothetical protein ACM3OC_03440 [Deltaproteobacteria bacterium]
MWRIFPWRFLLRRAALAKGFLDPEILFSRLKKLGRSDMIAPIELLRNAVELHSRGLINSQIIQYNLDWVWPYWVTRQFDPRDISFIPRAFSLTHINLTHRNWTAIGFPGNREIPIVDPRGLVTPFFDGWSIDFWLNDSKGDFLIPSRQAAAQSLDTNQTLAVLTHLESFGMSIDSRAEVLIVEGIPVCRISCRAVSADDGALTVSLRPYNPEGVSSVHEVELFQDVKGWRVNRLARVFFSEQPARNVFSDYRTGDVFRRIFANDNRMAVKDDVGMATAAAVFPVRAKEPKEVTVEIPLERERKTRREHKKNRFMVDWKDSLDGKCVIKVPDDKFRSLYESSLKMLVLHAQEDIYAGPFTYKRFWFRDASFILHALLSANFVEYIKYALDKFPERQIASGYFLSQEGEWDSNGEALWIMRRYCEMTGQRPPDRWRKTVIAAGGWIIGQRVRENRKTPHSGLLKAGFSCEHLGPSDYYYWDDFWGVAGLRAAAFFAGHFGREYDRSLFIDEADGLLASVERSLEQAAGRLGRPAMPASPYRRLDSGAIGSLTVGYPLKLWESRDPRILDTVEYILQNCMVDEGFFHDMSHSGINPYLSCHIAQVLLRAEDLRFFELMKAVARMASPTGQWPEAIHPRTHGGCMGDGEQIWACAEWVMLMRNCFVREEEKYTRLVLCSGIPPEWSRAPAQCAFGPAPTSYGTVSVSTESDAGGMKVSWSGNWHVNEPEIEVRAPGFEPVRARPGQTSVVLAPVKH